ncbi:unnamed protein product [Effrenium voratum]|nr:unnamed protein product [Effrenium voratum]
MRHPRQRSLLRSFSPLEPLPELAHTIQLKGWRPVHTRATAPSDHIGPWFGKSEFGEFAAPGLPALGVARVLPDAVVTGVSRGSVGLTRPPSRCEMLPVASGRYSWRRTKPFPECERSLEVIQDTPLRVLLSPGPEVEADASEDADFVLVDAGEAVEDGTQGSDLTLPGWHLV